MLNHRGRMAGCSARSIALGLGKRRRGIWIAGGFLILLVHGVQAQADRAGVSAFEFGQTSLAGFRCAPPEDCYRQAAKFLEPHRIGSLHDLPRSFGSQCHSPEQSDERNQGAQVILVGRRTPIVFLAIHGLYGTAAQFTQFQSDVTGNGFNSVSVTLPGDGPFGAQHANVHYEHWRRSVREAFALARALGEKVAVIGQSTGALLAYDLGLDYPTVVRGLVLIEPAFRVQSRLRWATCGLSGVIPTAQDVGEIANLVRPGVTSAKIPISLNLGCQVARLSAFVLGRVSTDSEDDATRFAKLFRWARAPIFLSFSSDDDVVDPRVIDALATQRKDLVTVLKSRPPETDEISQLRHGCRAQERLQGPYGSPRLLAFLESKVGVGTHFEDDYAYQILRRRYRDYVYYRDLFREVELSLKKMASWTSASATPLYGTVGPLRIFTGDASSQENLLACEWFNPDRVEDCKSGDVTEEPNLRALATRAMELYRQTPYGDDTARIICAKCESANRGKTLGQIRVELSLLARAFLNGPYARLLKRVENFEPISVDDVPDIAERTGAAAWLASRMPSLLKSYESPSCLVPTDERYPEARVCPNDEAFR